MPLLLEVEGNWRADLGSFPVHPSNGTDVRVTSQRNLAGIDHLRTGIPWWWPPYGSSEIGKNRME